MFTARRSTVPYCWCPHPCRPWPQVGWSSRNQGTAVCGINDGLMVGSPIDDPAQLDGSAGASHYSGEHSKCCRALWMCPPLVQLFGSGGLPWSHDVINGDNWILDIWYWLVNGWWCLFMANNGNGIIINYYSSMLSPTIAQWISCHCHSHSWGWWLIPRRI